MCDNNRRIAAEVRPICNFFYFKEDLKIKKWKKVVTAAAAVLAVMASAAAFAACGGNGAAGVADVYNANPSSEGTAMYLSAPMQMIVTSEESITVYDDGTYCLSVSYTAITNLKAVTEGNDQVINRGTTVLEYYGACTSAEDSGMTVLTLASPERVTISNTDSLMTGGLPVGYFDTENWTADEAMTSWWTSIAGGSGDCTGEAVLDKFAFDETVVTVSQDGIFDYLKYGYHFIILGGMFGIE